MGKPVREFMGVRVPPDMLDILKNWANSKEVKLSVVVICALALYIDEVIFRKCRLCDNPNDQDSQYCKKCGNALTPEAEVISRTSTSLAIQSLLDDPKFYESLRKQLAESRANLPPGHQAPFPIALGIVKGNDTKN